MQAQIQARVDSGVPLPAKKKTAKKPSGAQRAQVQPPVLPQPEQFQVPHGVLVAGSPSQHLGQIALKDIGPQAVGIVLSTRDAAEPYLHLSKPVAVGPLAIVLLGEDDLSSFAAHASAIQFPANCVATGEPALLKAVLVQLGAIAVVKRAPAAPAKLEMVESVVLRLSVYRDTWPQAWASLCLGPLKAILEHCAPLRSCDTIGCKCPCWHGLSGPRDPEPILELWGRHYASLQLRPCAAEDAEVFSVFIRAPSALLTPLLEFSERDGIFFEPRDGATRRVDPRFSVIWMPKASIQEITLCRQTQEHAIGAARIGVRLGIRCLQEHEEKLRRAIRPAVPFLGLQADKIYHVGPLPYGAHRQAVAKVLRTIGWNAKPLHTVPGGSGSGLWWAIQGGDDPPATVMHCDQGEILVTRPLQRPDRHPMPLLLPRPLCARLPMLLLPRQLPRTRCSATILGVNGSSRTDGRARSLPVTGEPVKPAVPAATALSSGNLSKLTERQVLTKVQQQVDSATCTLGQKVSNIESQLGVMQRKVDSQESTLQQMFAQQMSKIEELLAPKRPRKGDDGHE